MQNLKYVKAVSSEHTGGGIIIDFIELKNGKLIGIGENQICVYEDWTDFYDGECLNSFETDLSETEDLREEYEDLLKIWRSFSNDTQAKNWPDLGRFFELDNLFNK